MSMRAKQIGKRVKVLRQSKQWYQEDLAEKIGITQAHLSNIETGKVNITLEKLLLLHDVLGVPMAEFFVDIDGELAGGSTVKPVVELPAMPLQPSLLDECRDALLQKKE